jgi:hypothetical protein
MDRPKRISIADLDETVRSYPSEVRADKGRLIFTLAVTIISHFFGRQWVEDNIIQDAAHSRPDGFFRMDFSSDYEREKKTFRVVDFAETLFNLQHIPGFDDRVDQMRSGQVEATYAEFDFARFLYIHDVDFRFVIPSGVKGKDYDFGITYTDGRDACADAKCRLEETEIRADTLRHPLDAARSKNLPADRPGIVFIKVPQTWLDEASVRRRMYEVVNDFLRGTKRIVSVVVYATVLVHLSKREMMWMRHQFREITNPNHRFDQSKNWAVFRDYKVPEEWKGMPPKWVRVFSRGWRPEDDAVLEGATDDRAS